MNYDIIRIDDHTWRVEEEKVRFFLLEGEKEALLVDSGFRIRNAKEIAESLTDRPVKLLNTHADVDHIGSNLEFEAIYMHPDECVNYHRRHHKSGEIIPIRDSDVIDLGGRPLEVIAIPGHTPGSVAILDRDRRVLFGGDSIQDGTVFMYGSQRNLKAYQHSLGKLQRFTDKIDAIYPSHGNFPLRPEWIRELDHAVERIRNGEIHPEMMRVFRTSLKRYDTGIAVFLMDADFGE